MSRHAHKFVRGDFVYLEPSGVQHDWVCACGERARGTADTPFLITAGTKISETVYRADTSVLEAIEDAADEEFDK